MTERDYVTVSNATGPVHSGDGIQLNYYATMTDGAEWRLRKGVDPLRIAHDDRVRLAKRFVRPPGYGVAAARLKAPGSTVLLRGKAGIGRRTAALILLHDLDVTAARFEEISASLEDDEWPIPGEGDRFFLDLSGVADDIEYRVVQRRLAIHRTAIHDKGAHLVAVLPDAMDYALDPELAPYVVSLGRPRGIAVITRHLRMDAMEFRPALLIRPELKDHWERAPMRELARLAGLVRQASDSGRHGTDFAVWLDEAVDALTDHAGAVSHQLRDCSTVSDRALLLTAAVFDGAPTDVIFHAWQLLLETLGHDEEGPSGLARDGFDEQLSRRTIKRDDQGRVFFEQLAYAAAARRFFWSNFPDIRAGLRRWVGECVALDGLTTEDRALVAARFAEQALNIGNPEHVFELAEQWACAPSGRGRAGAVIALELGLGHERYAANFRRWVYKAVRERNITAELAQVLTVVCRQAMASTHVDQAVVRLHYLALRDGGEEVIEARDALLDLGSRSRRAYTMLLERLRHGPPARSDADLSLLAELLMPDKTPVPLLQLEFVSAWRAVLGRASQAAWSETVRRWLSAVEADQRLRPALELIPASASGDPRVLNGLYAIAHEWAADPEHRGTPRQAIAASFWQQIDAESGLDMANHSTCSANFGAT